MDTDDWLIEIANDEADFVEEHEFRRTHFVLTFHERRRHLDMSEIVSVTEVVELTTDPKASTTKLC